MAVCWATEAFEDIVPCKFNRRACAEVQLGAHFGPDRLIRLASKPIAMLGLSIELLVRICCGRVSALGI